MASLASHISSKLKKKLKEKQLAREQIYDANEKQFILFLSKTVPKPTNTAKQISNMHTQDYVCTPDTHTHTPTHACARTHAHTHNAQTHERARAPHTHEREREKERGGALQTRALATA